ncbi:MAG: sensor histidine kinase [Planctomycetota bacterium]|jgi:PAS domain S-box-containing protein
MRALQTDKARVLVVDGDAKARESILGSLTGSAMECLGEGEIAAACERVADGSVDVVIAALDWSKAQLQALARCVIGYDAILLCSGDSGESGQVQAAMRLGARGFIPKPWPDREELWGSIRESLLGWADLRQAKDSGSVSEGGLQEKYDELRESFVEQRRAFEESQEIFYIDLSRMMTIIGNIMDGIVFADCDANITLMNPVAEDFLGTKSFMTIGRPITGLSGKDDLVKAVREDYERVQNCRETTRTIEVHDGSKDLMYIKMHTSQVLDYRGNPAGTLTVMQDVTSDYKSDQLKNQYLSIVAHELRTPLTGIKTFSTMMVKGSLGSLTDKQVRVVESIREQSLRLEHQIDKLINLGHIESNEYGQDLEVFDACELVSHAVAPFEQPASDRSIRLNVDHPNEVLLVRGDRADLRRAIQALVENALKFTNDGESIVIEVEGNDGEARVTVRDPGIGIDPRYHNRIFEKFFQVEDPLTRHHGGAGLGLFFVRGIINAHGSEIEVESDLGQGASFSFGLPLVNAEALASSTGETDYSQS